MSNCNDCVHLPSDYSARMDPDKKQWLTFNTCFNLPSDYSARIILKKKGVGRLLSLVHIYLIERLDLASYRP